MQTGHVTAPDHAASSQKVLARAPSTRDPTETSLPFIHALRTVTGHARAAPVLSMGGPHNAPQAFNLSQRKVPTAFSA
jgi:hypothetical protein